MIFEINNLIEQDLSLLSSCADGEGYNHINRLIDDYKSGKNQFNHAGEKLIGYKVNEQLVAVCGLNIEPENNKFCRIRRLYVLPKYRKQRIGSELIKFLINHAVNKFTAVTVNIGRLHIDGFYENLGFKKVNPNKSYSHLYEAGRSGALRS